MCRPYTTHHIDFIDVYSQEAWCSIAYFLPSSIFLSFPVCGHWQSEVHIYLQIYETTGNSIWNSKELCKNNSNFANSCSSTILFWANSIKGVDDEVCYGYGHPSCRQTRRGHFLGLLLSSKSSDTRFFFRCTRPGLISFRFFTPRYRTKDYL